MNFALRIVLVAFCGLFFSCGKEPSTKPKNERSFANSAEKFYKVSPNTSAFPLPYELPQVGERSKDDFDWKAYIAASKSEADRAFRKRVARWDYGQPIAGGGDSKGAERTRGFLAEKEFKAKCEGLIRRYRKKLEGETKTLENLDKYIEHSEAAIALQVKLVDNAYGSMFAYLNYYRNLQALGSSLHLQDLPE